MMEEDMTREEHAAVLTGLRMLQAALLVGAEPTGIRGDSLMDILTNGDELTPINADQIDTLCERINGQPQERW